MTTATIASWTSIVAGLFAACFWMLSASRGLRDNLNKFMGDLQFQSKWNGWAALCSGVAAFAQVIDKVTH